MQTLPTALKTLAEQHCYEECLKLIVDKVSPELLRAHLERPAPRALEPVIAARPVPIAPATVADGAAHTTQQMYEFIAAEILCNLEINAQVTTNELRRLVGVRAEDLSWFTAGDLAASPHDYADRYPEWHRTYKDALRRFRVDGYLRAISFRSQTMRVIRHPRLKIIG